MNEMLFKMMVQIFGNHPMFKRAKEMSQGKNEQEMLQTIKNVCSQRGVSVEEAKKGFNSFLNSFGMNL